MSIFDYDDREEQAKETLADDGPERVTISHYGNPDYDNFRINIPSKVAEQIDIEAGNQAFVEPTENGFKVEVVDI